MGTRLANGLVRCCLLTALFATAPACLATEIESQRELFRSVITDVERGNWSAVSSLPAAEQQQLQDYVLWPDLRAAYLRTTLRRANRKEVNAFLQEYGTLKPARELRYRYALELVRQDDLTAFHEIYQSYYQGLEIESLDCLALRAELEQGRGQRVTNRAKELWLIGKSQVGECDEVFDYLSDNDLLSARDYLARYKLAIEAREFQLARWLGKSIDDAHAEEARLWLSAQSNPERFLASHASRQSSDSSKAQLAYAVERLTYRDPILALEHWATVNGRYDFPQELRLKTARHIALWTARDNIADAYDLLSDLPLAAQNDEVLRWRARISLRQQQWTHLLEDIALMSEGERREEEWRYWRAVALHRSGQLLAAKTDFELLARERSYYGFLSADEIDRPYSFEHSNLVVDEALIESMARRPELIRARELYLVGRDGRGRSEWDAAVAWFAPAQKAQAAILADRWAWHSRAIATAASVGEFNDLNLRYPLPFKSEFEEHASAAQISPTWAYGIARSESLFMRDIRSSAGAVGLMQLMPATGRSVAEDIELPYSGLDTLVNPQANIQLGTMYLGQMAERYDGNHVLATAAYNAGPHRVDRWRPQDGTLDARAWIENIPFNETRKYVRRVMAAETIFYWRIHGTARRLSDTLPLVEAPDQQVASR